MRHFSPSPIPHETEKWLYDALTRLQANASQSGAGFAAINRGEVPDGSGNPLTPDLTQYFFLPGRNGGQIGHGDTAASGSLTLSSTKSDTKGLIYLGTARGSAFDELNNRVGINTTAPTAKLHVKGEAATSIYWRPSSITGGAGFAVAGAVGPLTVNEVIADDLTGYVFSLTNNPSLIATMTFNALAGATTFPTGSTGWVLRFRVMKTKVGAVTFNWTFKNQSGATVKSGTVLDVTIPTGTWVTIPITLSAAEATSLYGAGTSTTCSLQLDGFTGLSGTFGDDQFRCTWIELEVASGTGTGLGGPTAIFQASATQLVNNTEWQSSAGTALIDVTAAGRLTVESGGTFRHVPGAAASTLFKGDANGDATWGTITLLSAYLSDTVAGTVVLGDLIVGNATPKWDKLAGNITTTRTFLRQTGNGSISALPAWDTLVAGDIPALSAAAGWTDDGTVVRLTTNTDQVGIGTTSPGASLGLVNVNATTDHILKITGKAAQTGDSIRVQDSALVARVQVQALAASTDVLLTPPSGGKARLLFTPSRTEQQYIDFGLSNDFGPPLGSNNGIPCPGTRFTTYWDSSNPQFCDAYGQDTTSAWVLVDTITDYLLVTPDTISASRTRAQWNPNGDLTNFGKIRSRKFTVGTTGLSAGVPGIELEETGAGTDAIIIRAPAVVSAASRIQLLQDMVGTFVMVGDDPPAVASRALGKVDLTAQAGAIASTALSNGSPAGLYAVEVYVVCTVASGSGAPTLDVTLGWTDVLGATTANASGLNLTTFPFPLSTTGRAQAKFILQLASGNITYSTTINAPSGSPQYAIYIRVLSLG